ncbi:alpha/beta hydrolase fold domain-containing protein [Amantichitinum ursilacus]|uniref:Carboxylesterase NlhH n=1 Tax=Amantichitinum ursilacus TaxID=857265 RepID=A0A0N0GMN1_9NEIS|nr:alpha/beta hydrolase fold domain-containing protein [Amantichitinum ursilacus]KPC51910.1 Carboxylesterase NlhH [Amantichitinum ursilacus]
MNQQEFQGRLEQARGKVKEWTGAITGNEERELAGKLEADAGRTTALNQAAIGVPDAQMQAVLDQLVKLGAKPVETLSVAAARSNPTPADAVVALLQARGQQALPQPVAKIENRTIDGATGPLQARIYWPQNAAAAELQPVIVYFHGGGWVIADLDVYDATPRALANGAQAIVISVHYRQAPEHRFPAAHDDAYAAWQWALHNAATLNGDPARIAIAGESAGGNLAASVTIRARDNNLQVPVHQLLVYPVTDYSFDTPSQHENKGAKPLDTAMLPWFYDKYLARPEDGSSPLFSVLRATDLRGLSPATIITAEIDPLRSDGEAYAQRLTTAGVPVRYHEFKGVTHEFFGMGAVLDKANDAVELASSELRQAFQHGQAPLV